MYRQDVLEAGKDGSCKNGKGAETWSREIQNVLGMYTTVMTICVFIF